MKKLATLLALAATLSAPAWAATKTVTLSVPGMTCEACAGEIERELRQVPGVVRADVSFEQRRAAIALSAAQPEVEPLIGAIEKAGYHASVPDR